MQEANQEELRQCHGQEIPPGALHVYILSESVEQEYFQGTQRPSLLPAMFYQAVWLVGEGYSIISCGGLVYSILALHIGRVVVRELANTIPAVLSIL